MRDPDPRTVQRARRGDLLAFEDLVREFQADAFRFAWHLTRDRQLAEDVTQEAFLRAFRFLEGFRGDRKFGSWLFSIVRNCAMDSLRSQRRSELPWDDQLRPRSVADPTARVELEAALRSLQLSFVVRVGQARFQWMIWKEDFHASQTFTFRIAR